MKARRRIILQLTPLLDLLLVVIFAQYMDLQSTSEQMVPQEQRRRRETQFISAKIVEQERSARQEAERQAQLRVTEAQAALERAEKLRDQALARMEAVNEQIKPLQQTNTELTRGNKQLKKQAESLAKELAERTKDAEDLARKLSDKQTQERIARAKAQREAEERARMKSNRDLDAIGSIVREMLNVDDRDVKEALSGGPPGQTTRILGELQALRNVKNPAAIVRHLQKTVELKKRCDFWEIHMLSDDSVRVKMRGKVIEPKMYFKSTDDFTTQLLDLIKTQEDPKNLVLILVSYSEVRYGTRKTASQGLATVVTFLEAYWKGTRRIHVSDLGRTKEAP